MDLEWHNFSLRTAKPWTASYMVIIKQVSDNYKKGGYEEESYAEENREEEASYEEENKTKNKIKPIWLLIWLEKSKTLKKIIP